MSDYNSSLPIRTESNGDAAVKIVDGTIVSQALSVDSSGKVHAKLNDGSGNLVTSQANGAQRALDVGVNVAGVQVDPRSIRALTSSDVVSANIRDATGTAFSNTNPLPVTLSPNPGVEVNDYHTSAAVAAAASVNFDYTVTALKTLQLNQVEAAASGKSKIEVKVETGVGAGTFNSYFVKFNSTASPNMSVQLKNAIAVAAGVKVRVTMTNLDNQAQDLYATICGLEN